MRSVLVGALLGAFAMHGSAQSQESASYSNVAEGLQQVLLGALDTTIRTPIVDSELFGAATAVARAFQFTCPGAFPSSFSTDLDLVQTANAQYYLFLNLAQNENMAQVSPPNLGSAADIAQSQALALAHSMAAGKYERSGEAANYAAQIVSTHGCESAEAKIFAENLYGFITLGSSPNITVDREVTFYEARRPSSTGLICVYDTDGTGRLMRAQNYVALTPPNLLLLFNGMVGRAMGVELTEASYPRLNCPANLDPYMPSWEHAAILPDADDAVATGASVPERAAQYFLEAIVPIKEAEGQMVFDPSQSEDIAAEIILYEELMLPLSAIEQEAADWLGGMSAEMRAQNEYKALERSERRARTDLFEQTYGRLPLFYAPWSEEGAYSNWLQVYLAYRRAVMSEIDPNYLPGTNVDPDQ